MNRDTILIYSVEKESVSITTSLKGTAACSIHATRQNARDLLPCKESIELRLFIGGPSALSAHVDLPERVSLENDLSMSVDTSRSSIIDYLQ